MKTVLLTACVLVALGATAGAFDDQQPKGTGTVQKGAPPPHVPTIFRPARSKPATGKAKPAPQPAPPPAPGRRGGQAPS